MIAVSTKPLISGKDEGDVGESSSNIGSRLHLLVWFVHVLEDGMLY
jgi:hypothetical protein